MTDRWEYLSLIVIGRRISGGLLKPDWTEWSLEFNDGRKFVSWENILGFLTYAGWELISTIPEEYEVSRGNMGAGRGSDRVMQYRLFCRKPA
jgi:hypothetical protein